MNDKLRDPSCKLRLCADLDQLRIPTRGMHIWYRTKIWSHHTTIHNPNKLRSLVNLFEKPTFSGKLLICGDFNIYIYVTTVSKLTCLKPTIVSEIQLLLFKMNKTNVHLIHFLQDCIIFPFIHWCYCPYY